MAAWLNDDEMRAWRGLVVVLNDVRANLEADLLAQHGITEGDYAVLVNLSESEGMRMRMCDLAGRLHLSPSGLTRRLDGLVNQGFVAREADPDDRRVSLAALTRTGLRKLQSAAPDHVVTVRRNVFDHLTPKQVRQLGDVLAAVEAGRTAGTLAGP